MKANQLQISSWFAARVLLMMASIMSTASISAAAGFADRVRTTGGSEAGEITGMTPLEVSLDKGTAGEIKIPVNQIRSVLFDGEPPELTQARLNAKNGGYSTAIERLDEIKMSDVSRDAIRADIDYFRAYCAAQQALGGKGDITDAGRKLNEFVRHNSENFHYLEAVETVGDLLMASGKYPAAQKQYAELAKAPWPDYKLRAATRLGETFQAQGKHAEAIEQFDEVLSSSETGSAAAEQKMSASLAKAVSLAETEHLDEAVRMIEPMIAETDPEQKELQARAYNALGDCYERAGRNQDALLAYLHVDVLYNTVPEAHAEALSHLAKLWDAVGQATRAREARQLLEERYPSSRWAK